MGMCNCIKLRPRSHSPRPPTIVGVLAILRFREWRNNDLEALLAHVPHSQKNLGIRMLGYSPYYAIEYTCFSRSMCFFDGIPCACVNSRSRRKRPWYETSLLQTQLGVCELIIRLVRDFLRWLFLGRVTFERFYSRGVSVSQRSP